MEKSVLLSKHTRIFAPFIYTIHMSTLNIEHVMCLVSYSLLLHHQYTPCFCCLLFFFLLLFASLKDDEEIKRRRITLKIILNCAHKYSTLTTESTEARKASGNIMPDVRCHNKQQKLRHKWLKLWKQCDERPAMRKREHISIYAIFFFPQLSSACIGLCESEYIL